MYNKTLFSVTLAVGTLIAISSYSWMGMWMGLEINLLSFIPLVSDTKNSMASEAALKYFITQAMASTLLLFAFIMISMNIPFNLMMNHSLMLILNTALLTKMGSAPFHFWFPEVIEGLSWTNSAILLIWQKIAPMVMIMFFNLTTMYLTMVVTASMIISGVVGLNQVSLRKILAYSSINHIGWMLGAMWFSETVWMYYFAIYSLITVSILLMFKMLNILYLPQLTAVMNYSTIVKLHMMVNWMSLGGLPPFLGFFPKWITVQILISQGFIMLTTMMIVMTLMTLYFYIRIMFSTMLLSTNELTFHYNFKIKSFSVFTLTTISSSGLVLSTILFNYL
uniref:NADH-ubiquinone oxidoreductase chain 2 n=1 Tax=Cheirotonus gestroi TaxID=1207173 RepID=A0A6H0EYH6_9SCAR|nr:NADH dehydrogenase subunit 2 [Cheirotonus gestroi]QIT06599.1 NADH dehydrogenase subunit 2 [Cheirotonus gestroi]